MYPAAEAWRLIEFIKLADNATLADSVEVNAIPLRILALDETTPIAFADNVVPVLSNDANEADDTKFANTGIAVDSEALDEALARALLVADVPPAVSSEASVAADDTFATIGILVTIDAPLVAVADNVVESVLPAVSVEDTTLTDDNPAFNRILVSRLLVTLLEETSPEFNKTLVVKLADAFASDAPL